MLSFFLSCESPFITSCLIQAGVPDRPPPLVCVILHRNTRGRQTYTLYWVVNRGRHSESQMVALNQKRQCHLSTAHTQNQSSSHAGESKVLLLKCSLGVEVLKSAYPNQGLPPQDHAGAPSSWRTPLIVPALIVPSGEATCSLTFTLSSAGPYFTGN